MRRSNTPIARKLRALTAGLVLALVPTVAMAVPANATPTCPVVSWGSLAKADPQYSTQPITNIRTGQHDCFDRIVFDLTGYGLGWTGYDVRYVDNVYQDGSGFLVPVKGGAKLQIVVRAPAYSDGGATYTPADPANLTNVTGYHTFRQVAFAGSFEGQTTVGLGVRARLPFRAFVIGGPGFGEQRLVVDVAHAWTAL